MEHENNELLDEVGVAISYTQEGDTGGTNGKVRPHARECVEDTS